MTPRRILFATSAVIVLVTIGILAIPTETIDSPPRSTATSQPNGQEKLRPPFASLGRPAIQPLPPADSSDPALRCPLADDLLAAGKSPDSDMAIVLSLFDHFLEKCGGMPVGSNQEIVNAFTGNNPKRIAFLARNHPAINAQGELVDRWGSPLFFHNVARDLISIRSAGPDGEIFTADDLVEESARLKRP
jgi:hypothetical protein